MENITEIRISSWMDTRSGNTRGAVAALIIPNPRACCAFGGIMSPPQRKAPPSNLKVSLFFRWLRLKYKHYLERKIDFDHFDQKLSLKLDRLEDA